MNRVTRERPWQADCGAAEGRRWLTGEGTGNTGSWHCFCLDGEPDSPHAKQAIIMPKEQIWIYQVKGEKVVGEPRDAAGKFASDAEKLQQHAYSLGATLGMKTIACAGAVLAEQSLAFRFARSSSEPYDAIGAVASGEAMPLHGLFQHLG